MAEMTIEGRKKGEPWVVLQKDGAGNIRLRAMMPPRGDAYTTLFLKPREARRVLAWLKEQFPEAE